MDVRTIGNSDSELQPIIFDHLMVRSVIRFYANLDCDTCKIDCKMTK